MRKELTGPIGEALADQGKAFEACDTLEKLDDTESPRLDRSIPFPGPA